MGKVNILDFSVANLIAAGEVVDRPASVLKELLENAIDAGATEVTAEVRRGGAALIRVSDNGCGMAPEDLPLAIKRHATSKIRDAADLDGIETLGFRGEALAAIAAVSVLRIVSKTKEAESGTLLVADGGEVTEVTEVGCADGTSVSVEDLFANVPARRKFLKKDATELLACSAVMEKVAMSRPDISFRMIADGTVRFRTAGDGKVQDNLYAVFGREIATRLLPVHAAAGGITVDGFVGRSDNVKSNRNFQNCFINGRYVRSKTVAAALERAFTSYIAGDKFPVAALYLTLLPGKVDVNVHPAKLEVKFSDEHAVFEAVYFAVRQALEAAAYRPEMTLGKQKKDPLRTFVPIGAEKGEQTSIPLSAPPKPAEPAPAPTRTPASPVRESAPASPRVSVPPRLSVRTEPKLRYDAPETPAREAPAPARCVPGPAETAAPAKEAPAASVPAADTPAEETLPPLPPYRIAGVAFDTYILVETEGALLVIDQHAAHERLLFEELKKNGDRRPATQPLLVPLSVPLTPDDVAAAVQNRERLRAAGFDFTPKPHGVLLSAIPDAITVGDAEDLFSNMLASLSESGEDPAVTEELRREKMLYQIACKAAIKGGWNIGDEQRKALVERLLRLPDIVVCPHGRPVALRLSKHELDHRFERV